MKTINVTNCPVDGSPGVIYYKNINDVFFGTPGKWIYRKSEATGHFWLDPRPNDDHIGSLYENYYTHSAEQSSDAGGIWQRLVEYSLSSRLGYPRPINSSLLIRILSLLPTVRGAAELEVMCVPASATGRLLDVGCGGGKFLRRMKHSGWDVTGTEPDKNAAARLSERDGFPVYSSLDELIKQIEQPFDVIVLSHVLEHVTDPIQMFAQLRSLLSDKGRIIITTPNAKSLGSMLFRQYWRGLEPPRHFNIFTLDSISQTLGISGLTPVALRTEARLARGIWYLSYLAKMGHVDLEIKRSKNYRVLKVLGYFFQVFEAALLVIKFNLGEEIYCVAQKDLKSGGKVV